MSTLHDIIGYAFDKNADGVRQALDVEMGERIAAAMNDLRTDVAAQMFATPVAVEEQPSDESDSDEGLETDENV